VAGFVVSGGLYSTVWVRPTVGMLVADRIPALRRLGDARPFHKH